MWITEESQKTDGKTKVSLKAVEKNWETWQIRMLDLLRPSFVLPFEFTLEPNEILYDVTGRKPIQSIQAMTEEKMDQILDDVEKLIEICPEYWLDPGNFCRDPQHLYLDSESRIAWIYEPSVEPEVEETWKKSLMRSILQVAIEQKWEDRVILKCYHRYQGDLSQSPFQENLQENPERNSESRKKDPMEKTKKKRIKFPYFRRNH